MFIDHGKRRMDFFFIGRKSSPRLQKSPHYSKMGELICGTFQQPIFPLGYSWWKKNGSMMDRIFSTPGLTS